MLTFDAAQRGNYQASQQNFNVLIDGSVVGTFTPSGTSYQSYSTAAFTVTAGTHTITFQGLDSAGGDNTAFLDQVAVAPASTPAIGDPGFEQVVVGAGNFQYDPTGSPWAFSGSSGISGNNSGFTSGNPPAPQGVQVAFLQGTGSFTQTVTGWAAGTYVLTFDAAQRGNYQASQQNFNVLIDGNVVGTFTPSGTSYQSYSTAAFTVTAGTHTITFQGLDSAGGDNTAFLDQVAVAAANTPAIGDPGFEQVVVGAGNFQYDPTGSPWTFSGLSGISGNNSGFTSGNPPAPRAVQVAILQETGSFTQTVSRLGSGQLRAQLRRRTARKLPGAAAELQRADRRQCRGHLHTIGDVLPELLHRRVHRHRRDSYDHIPRIGQCRRRQHRFPRRRHHLIVMRHPVLEMPGFADTCG